MQVYDFVIAFNSHASCTGIESEPNIPESVMVLLKGEQ